MVQSNRICLYSLLGPKFPVSGDRDAYYPPGTGRIPFIEDLSSFRGGGAKDVQNVLLAPTLS